MTVLHAAIEHHAGPGGHVEHPQVLPHDIASPSRPRGAQLYIDNLGVTDRLRRRGLATALLEAIARWGTELGCELAWIVTEPENEAANALHRAIGASAEPVTLYSFTTLQMLRSDR